MSTFKKKKMNHSRIVSEILKTNFDKGNGWKTKNTYYLFFAHDQMEFNGFPTFVKLKSAVAFLEPQLNGTLLTVIKI